MFDFGFGYSEMLVVAVVAIIVIGPKDLPKVLRALGRTVAKMRGMAREFQGHLDAAMKESGFDEVKKEIANIKNPANIIDPVKAPFPADDKKKQEQDFAKYFGDAAPADAKAPGATAPAATAPVPAAPSTTGTSTPAAS